MNKLSILFAMKARLAAAVLLAAFLVPSASAQFIYVSNAGEDTVSKIDINSNTEVARYATWFTPPTVTPPNPGLNYIAHPGNAWAGAAPSRIAQDSAGNVYVLDRFFSTPNLPHLPVLLKIAPSGGTPGVDTSNGPTNVLPIIDINNSNQIDSGEAKDVRILWAKPIGVVGTDEGAYGRALAIDKSGNLWVGMFNKQYYYKVDPNTGNMIGGAIPAGRTPYGCQVDTNGKLWSVNLGSTLTEIDTATNVVTQHDHPTFGGNYSVSLFNGCGLAPNKVYVSSSAKTYTAYDPSASAFSNPSTTQFFARAIGVDSQGNIFAGDGTTGRVIKNNPTGTLLWDTNAVGSTVGPADLRGIIVDVHDDVWAVHRDKNRVVKYSGANLNWIATVPVGDSPYTYGNPPPPTCEPTPAPGCAQVTGEARCLPGGGYSYTFTATNSTGSDMSQILLTPLPGSTFTLSPQLFNLSSPLHNGQSTTLTVTIGNGKAGDKVCFFVSLMADKAPCCNVQVCLTLPRCGDIPAPPRVGGYIPPRPQLPRGRRRP